MTNTTPPDAPARPKRRRNFRRIVVTQVEQLSPRMVRVTFTGDDLAAFGWSGPAAHLKLVFPEPGQDEPAMPDPEQRPARMRTYTPRRFDPNVPELDIEFVLHGDGPAAAWASQARAGQSLVMAGPGPAYAVEPADWYLLAGDDTALPAIASVLDVLPAGAQARVLLEVAGAEEQRPLASAAHVDLVWLTRDQAGPGAALEQALRDEAFPAGAGRVYVGCEAGAMRRIRAYLLRERGLDPATIVTRGYWRQGATDYTDRDYGDDVT